MMAPNPGLTYMVKNCFVIGKGLGDGKVEMERVPVLQAVWLPVPGGAGQQVLWSLQGLPGERGHRLWLLRLPQGAMGGRPGSTTSPTGAISPSIISLPYSLASAPACHYHHQCHHYDHHPQVCQGLAWPKRWMNGSGSEATSP